eukprot:3262083-Ditylum_brightwellii.AAC.1
MQVPQRLWQWEHHDFLECCRKVNNLCLVQMQPQVETAARIEEDIPNHVKSSDVLDLSKH